MKRYFLKPLKAGRHALDGLWHAFRTETAFQQEVLLALPLSLLALWLPLTYLEKLMLLGSLWLVLIVELLNTAVEATIDRISLEHHSLSKQAKDAGAAAVFLSIFLCVVVWGSVLWHHYF